MQFVKCGFIYPAFINIDFARPTTRFDEAVEKSERFAASKKLMVCPCLSSVLYRYFHFSKQVIFYESTHGN